MCLGESSDVSEDARHLCYHHAAFFDDERGDLAVGVDLGAVFAGFEGVVFGVETAGAAARGVHCHWDVGEGDVEFTEEDVWDAGAGAVEAV